MGKDDKKTQKTFRRVQTSFGPGITKVIVGIEKAFAPLFGGPTEVEVKEEDGKTFIEIVENKPQEEAKKDEKEKEKDEKKTKKENPAIPQPQPITINVTNTGATKDKKQDDEGKTEETPPKKK